MICIPREPVTPRCAVAYRFGTPKESMGPATMAVFCCRPADHDGPHLFPIAAAVELPRVRGEWEAPANVPDGPGGGIRSESIPLYANGLSLVWRPQD